MHLVLFVCLFFKLLVFHLWCQFMFGLRNHLKQRAQRNHHCDTCAQTETQSIAWPNCHSLWPTVSQFIWALTLLAVSLTTIDSVWIVCADTKQHLIPSDEERAILKFHLGSSDLSQFGFIFAGIKVTESLRRKRTEKNIVAAYKFKRIVEWISRLPWERHFKATICCTYAWGRIDATLCH